MTAPDGIRIETAEERDSVLPYSRTVDADGWRLAGGSRNHDGSVNIGDTVTHLADPVADRLARRQRALANAELLREWAPYYRAGVLHAIADALDDDADAWCPEVLAAAAERQARPATVMVELPRDVVEGWAARTAPSVLAVYARAALDAEGGQG